MAYSRREVQDHVTIMNKDLYDNLQDGVEEAKEEVVKKSKEANLYTDEKVAEVNQYVDSKISDVNTKAETATSIAKGRNKAKVFSTTEAMQIWLSTEENKGLCNVGDNLYIVDTEVPDWWIAEVLNSVDDETGYYYKIAQLETQKVDLSSYDEKIKELEEDIEYQNEILFGTGDETNMNITEQVNEMYNVMVIGKPCIFAMAHHSRGNANGQSNHFNFMSSDSDYFVASNNTITIVKDGTYFLDILVGGSGMEEVTLKRNDTVIETYTSALTKQEIELLTGGECFDCHQLCFTLYKCRVLFNYCLQIVVQNFD